MANECPQRGLLRESEAPEFPAYCEEATMKKIALIALAASAAIATPAAAQTATGIVNITGSVAAKCMVVPIVTPAADGSTFGTTVAMGELAQSDGTLKDTATLAGTFGSVGGAGLSAHVVCTSAGTDVTVNADPLVSATAGGSGYTNTVNFTADVTFTKVSGPQIVSNASTAPAATAASLGARLAATGTNVSIATSAWNATGILVAATDYTGKITVVISPGV
jgi:hypothetical protein